MPVNVSICGRTVALSYPNKSLKQLEDKVGYSIIGKASEDKTLNVAGLVKDTAAWLWAGSLKDSAPLKYEEACAALDEMTLRELDAIKKQIEAAFLEALPEKKEENPPTPANQN